MSIEIKVLLFASAREAAGNISETSLSLDEGATTTIFRYVYTSLKREGTLYICILLTYPSILHFRRVMAEKYPGLSSLVLDEDSLTLALNEEYIESEVVLKNGDTIALIPPISGG